MASMSNPPKSRFGHALGSARGQRGRGRRGFAMERAWAGVPHWVFIKGGVQSEGGPVHGGSIIE